MIVYDNNWLSYGALRRPLGVTYPYVQTVPVLRPGYDDYYRPYHSGYDYNYRPSYSGHGYSRPGLTLGIGGGGSGLTIIIRP